MKFAGAAAGPGKMLALKPRQKARPQPRPVLALKPRQKARPQPWPAKQDDAKEAEAVIEVSDGEQVDQETAEAEATSDKPIWDGAPDHQVNAYS